MLIVGMALLSCALALTLIGCIGDGFGGNGPSMGLDNPGHPRDNTPVVLEVTQPGIDAVDDAKIAVDFSNISEGYFCVRSKLEGVKVKVLVSFTGNQNQYQYIIQNTSQFIVVPLSDGNGTYSIGVWENVPSVSENAYAAIYAREFNAQLDDEYKPFLYPNQFVNFSAGDAAVRLSQQVTEGATSELEAINGIYYWVANNIDYDENKALTVVSGYLPNNASTISTKTGICFDYAVLTVSMLRAQRIPAKLVIGFAGNAYHAWIETYSPETGRVQGYQFDGVRWVRMDPTFDAARRGYLDLPGTIGDGTNYQSMFYH